MSLIQRLCFKIERNGEPIEQHHVKHVVNSGISYGRLLSILVPVYEEQEALRYANYNPSQWQELHWSEKAFHVAHYRFARLIKLHGNDAVSEKMEQDSKKANSKMRRR